MPGLDGFATSQRIRSLAGYRDVPIIMITAANMEDIDAMDARGINHYMFKPLQVSLLFETIMDVLAGSIPHPQPVGAGERPLVGRQILVVDDSEFNQEVAADLLTMEGAVRQHRRGRPESPGGPGPTRLRPGPDGHADAGHGRHHPPPRPFGHNPGTPACPSSP